MYCRVNTTTCSSGGVPRVMPPMMRSERGREENNRQGKVGKEAGYPMMSMSMWRVPIRMGESTLLDLADNLTRFGQRFDHLDALLPAPDCVVAFFEKIIKLALPVHVLEEFTLHFIPCEPSAEFSSVSGNRNMTCYAMLERRTGLNSA